MGKPVFPVIEKILASLALLTFASCGNDSNPEPLSVTITRFYPSSGIVGSSVTIYGDQFIPTVSPEKGVGPHPNTSIISFNGTVAQAEYVYQDSIGKQHVNSKVPSGATSGKINATVNGKTVSSLDDFIISVPNYLPNVKVSTVPGVWGLDVAIDSKGNLYVTHKEPNEIVKITPDGNVFILWSSNTGEIPYKIAVDATGNVYATVVGSYVLKIDADGKVSKLAGSNECGYMDGHGASARFCILGGIAVDNDGNVYVADILNYKIRKITSNGAVSTLAGSTMGFKDGSRTNAQFGLLNDVALDAHGNIYVADGFRIRKVSSAGQVSTFAGSKPGYLDGTTTDAQFTAITSIAIDTNGNLYLGDSGSAIVVRRITTDGIVATVAGSTPGNVDGSGSNAKFARLAGITFDESGAVIIAQGASNGPLRKIEIN